MFWSAGNPGLGDRRRRRSMRREVARSQTQQAFLFCHDQAVEPHSSPPCGVERRITSFRDHIGAISHASIAESTRRLAAVASLGTPTSLAQCDTKRTLPARFCFAEPTPLGRLRLRVSRCCRAYLELLSTEDALCLSMSCLFLGMVVEQGHGREHRCHRSEDVEGHDALTPLG